MLQSDALTKASQAANPFEPHKFCFESTQNRRAPDFILPSIKAGKVFSVISPGGAGKSMLMLEFAISIAIGRDIAGIGDRWNWQPKRGRVVFISREDDDDDIADRIKAIMVVAGMEAAEIEQMHRNLHIYTMPEQPIDIMRNECLEHVLQITQGSRLVVFDTLRKIHLLDENSSHEMAALLDRLQKIASSNGTSVAFLHHTNKISTTNAQAAQQPQQSARGSSVITDNGRGQLCLIEMTKQDAREMGIEEDERHQYVKLVMAKANYGKRESDVWLQRMHGGVLVCSELGGRQRGRRQGAQREQA